MTQNITIASGTPSAIRQHYYSRKIKIYLFVIILITLWLGFYGVEKYLEYSRKIAVAAEAEKFIQDVDPVLSAEHADNAKIKEDYAEFSDSMNGEIAKIFPTTEEYTDLTRLLDDFFKQNNLSNNPIIATDLQFSQSVKDPKSQYMILPFSINIESSEKNFYKFLSFIESSGSLAGKIRLMDIESIQLNFSQDEENNGKPKRMRFSAKLRAYSELTNN